jgi:Phosphorylase superfamily
MDEVESVPESASIIAAPILDGKDHAEPSAFTPESLLRESRRQKGLGVASVPRTCVLDPDGDIARHLVASGRAHLDPDWACYHTDLQVVDDGDIFYGIIGGAVGASFAVLVAEELFASGCTLLLSVTSAGEITGDTEPPYFVLVERALRDEGTSYHYVAPSRYAAADPVLLERLEGALAAIGPVIKRGSTWTTDAPFRETASAIEARRAEGILAVEMEAAALYSLASARGYAVVCFAHVTNQMGQTDLDFEKGDASGAPDALLVIEATITPSSTGTPAPPDLARTDRDPRWLGSRHSQEDPDAAVHGPP